MARNFQRLGRHGRQRMGQRSAQTLTRKFSFTAASLVFSGGLPVGYSFIIDTLGNFLTDGGGNLLIAHD